MRRHCRRRQRRHCQRRHRRRRYCRCVSRPCRSRQRRQRRRRIQIFSRDKDGAVISFLSQFFFKIGI